MPNPEEPMRPVDIVFPEAERLKALREHSCVKPPFGCGSSLAAPMGLTEEQAVRANFKDELSYKEYLISGLCQECQDLVFAEPEPTEDNIDPNYGDPKD